MLYSHDSSFHVIDRIAHANSFCYSPIASIINCQWSGSNNRVLVLATNKYSAKFSHSGQTTCLSPLRF